MFDFEKTSEKMTILEGVGYGPAGSTKTTEALVCSGELVLTRPHGEWPSS
jgi:hypothetical protein